MACRRCAGGTLRTTHQTKNKTTARFGGSRSVAGYGRCGKSQRPAGLRFPNGDLQPKDGSDRSRTTGVQVQQHGTPVCKRGQARRYRVSIATELLSILCLPMYPCHREVPWPQPQSAGQRYYCCSLGLDAAARMCGWTGWVVYKQTHDWRD